MSTKVRPYNEIEIIAPKLWNDAEKHAYLRDTPIPAEEAIKATTPVTSAISEAAATTSEVMAYAGHKVLDGVCYGPKKIAEASKKAKDNVKEGFKSFLANAKAFKEAKHA